jgi:glucose/arabinose dehydrogenase
MVVASGLDRPLDLQSPPGDRQRLFVVEQGGLIRVVRSGALLASPFLDLSAKVRRNGNAQGLLGLAFHPGYAQNGRFFVTYTDIARDLHVAEFHASPSADQAEPGSERRMLSFPDPAAHHGGGLAFGRDGFLYTGMGYGGLPGDPAGNAQNGRSLLGKMLRIDVDRGSPYAIPPDNPFLGRSDVRGEIWAFGLRNPWRWALDPATGDLYVADVGENRRDEIDVGLASNRGGENYGWSVMEGSLCFDPPSSCNANGLTLPVLDFPDGCAVVGGPVYRGCRMPGYQGTYFYGDYCGSFIRSFRLSGGAATEPRDWEDQIGRNVDLLSSFGVDADGEMYLVDHTGEVFRIVPAN